MSLRDPVQPAGPSIPDRCPAFVYPSATGTALALGGNLWSHQNGPGQAHTHSPQTPKGPGMLVRFLRLVTFHGPRHHSSKLSGGLHWYRARRWPTPA